MAQPQPHSHSSAQQHGAGQAQAIAHSEALTHLMPSSLKMVPNWYENAPFRYNLRFVIGLLPGLLLLLTVTGRRMMTFLSLGGIGVVLIRGAGIPRISLIATLCHVLVLEVVNMYCMAPLVWGSVLNMPLFVVFHYFIALSGLWWCHQDEEFKNQDPRFVILAEKFMFCLVPVASVTTITWVGGILFGRFAIAFIVCLASLLSIALYMVPLQASSAKPQTPTDVGLIQYRFVVWMYLALQLLLSPILYSAINYDGSTYSFLMLLVMITVNPFLLTLLEAQGLFHWTPLGPAAVRVLRWTTGTIVLALLSLLILTQHRSSTYLPLLLVPTLFIQLGLVLSASSFDHTHSSASTLVLGVALGLVYSLAFFLLPWSITHFFSFLSLPLNLVQLILWCLAIATIVIVTIWKRTSLQLLVIYNTVFVFCEYLLTWDTVYPVVVSMATAGVASVMFWRLYTVKQLPTNSALLSVSLHLTKLSFLLPSPHPHALTTSTLVTTISIFIVSYALLRIVLFDEPGQSSSSQLLVCSGLLCIGLILSVDSVLSPLWAAATNREPSGASLVATILATLGVFVLFGLSQVKDKDGRPSLLTVTPHGLFVMAALVGVLQPEFNMSELVESFTIAAGDHALVPEEVYLTAWSNLLTWVTLYTAIFTLILLLYMVPLTVIAISFLGVLTGFLCAITLAHFPPASVLGMLHATMMGLGGAILGRAFVASKRNRSFLDTLLFAGLLVTFVLLYWTEWTSFPRHQLPWKRILEYYALPSTKVFLFLSFIMAVAFRVKMHFLGQSYLPMIGNLFCLLFFLLATLHPFHQFLEISVLLTSCVFLLAQPDGFLFPKTSTIFLAPSLILSVTLLYVISATTTMPHLMHAITENQSLLVVARIVELVCLLATVPGQSLFLYHLWCGQPLHLSLLFIMLYIGPNALLPQFASSVASSSLGGIGVLSFCLLAIGDYSSIKI